MTISYTISQLVWRSCLMLGILIALAAGTLMIHNIHHEMKAQGNTTDYDTFPNAIVSHAVYTRTGSDGLLIDQLTTSQATHYPHDNTTVFTNPQLITYQNGNVAWDLRADHGVSHQGTDVIHLSGHVVVLQKNTPNNLRLTTTTLTVYPHQQLANTTAPVVIYQPQNTLHATGLRINLQSGTINLLSHARGQYVPSP